MKRYFNVTFWLTFSGIALIILVTASYLYLIEKSPLEFDEMDFDNNGFVTFCELISANIDGTPNVSENDGKCMEYYALKVGLMLKRVCNGNNYERVNG